jgi:hypothetical protein
MNIELTQYADPTRVAAIRQHNDRFRQGLGEGALSLSAGIISLGAETQARIIAAVAAFDDFDDGDLTDIHALGDFVIAVHPNADAPAKPALIFFRIDPSPTACRSRVLTIMLASEW